MPEIFDDGSVLSTDEQADIVACLENQTVFGIFLTAFLWDSGPLSEETSACLHSGFEGVDLREAMTPDHPDRKQYDRAEAVFLTGYFVAIACRTKRNGTPPPPSWAWSGKTRKTYSVSSKRWVGRRHW